MHIKKLMWEDFVIILPTRITSFTLPLSADIFAFFSTDTPEPIHVIKTNFDRLLSSSPLIILK